MNGLPYTGYYSTYTGGGYIFKGYDENTLLNSIHSLQSVNWIDRFTSAIFVQFTTFNPNVNQFSSIMVLFELTPSGTIIKTMDINTVILYDFNQSAGSLIIACFVIFILFIIFYMIKEVRMCIKQKLDYFKHLWNYEIWCIIAFAWAAFVMYIYKLYAVYKIPGKLNSTETVNLQYITSVTDTYRWMLAFCTFLSGLRFLKLLRFNRNMAYLSLVLRSSFVELVLFSISFIIMFLAFTQLMYLIFYDKLSEYRSFSESLISSFLMMLNKFDTTDLLLSNAIFGIEAFILFIITISIVMITMFMAILNGAFEKVRKGSVHINEEDFEIFSYMVNKCKMFIAGFFAKRSNTVGVIETEEKTLEEIKQDLKTETLEKTTLALEKIDKVLVRIYFSKNFDNMLKFFNS